MQKIINLGSVTLKVVRVPIWLGRCSHHDIRLPTRNLTEPMPRSG